MTHNVYHFGLRPTRPPRQNVALGFDPETPWVAYSDRGRLTFLPREIADEFDLVLGYRSVGVSRIFGVEELDAMRASVALFGLAFPTVGEFVAGLQHVQREGDVLDSAHAPRRAA